MAVKDWWFEYCAALGERDELRALLIEAKACFSVLRTPIGLVERIDAAIAKTTA